MPDEQHPRRKSTAARPDFRRMIVETANPPSAPAEPTGSDVQQNELEEQGTQTQEPGTRARHEQPVIERQRHRTTVFLSPEIEDLVDRMKIAAKREGRRESLQEYIEQGIRLLAQSRGLSIEE